MKKRSFRSIIIFTLVLVTGTVSFVAFHTFSHILERKIYDVSEKNIASSIGLLKDQFYLTFEGHDGRILETIIKNLNEKDQMLNSYVFNSEKQLKYAFNMNSTENLTIPWEEISNTKDGIYFQSFALAEKPFSRTYIQIQNSSACYKCHEPEQKSLGLLVVDFSFSKQKSINTFISRSSLFFTLLMVSFIGIFILFMHYRFVRKSLRNFNTTINSINNGNLEVRLSIPETKELGILGKNFNNMLNTLQQTQNELQEFHKKELKSNYKLATIGEMSAKLAHEIRNPVTGIANAIEIIVKETKDSENIPILEEIQRQAERVNTAISHLLKYSRKKDLNLEKNSINDLIKSILAFLNSQVKGKTIIFNQILRDNVPLFGFDHGQMEDVLLNLGINAIQAIPNNGSVTFETRFDPVQNKVIISVSDTGIGIPEENLSRIFHPFYTTRNEGTGLGLAIVNDITEKHGGEVYAENNKTGGCTFFISLPVEKG
jgi:signal transduction histidine kinase